MLSVLISVLFAGLVSADHFYVYVDAPGSEFDKWLVDEGSVPWGEFLAHYYFLTSKPEEAASGFNGGGQYGNFLFNPHNDPLGVTDYLLTDRGSMNAVWPNGIIETDYNFYVCNSEDTRVPTDQWILYGKLKNDILSVLDPSISPVGLVSLPIVSDVSTDILTPAITIDDGGESTPADGSGATDEVPVPGDTTVTPIVDSNTDVQANTDIEVVNTDIVNTDVVNTDNVANTDVVVNSEIPTTTGDPVLRARETKPVSINFDRCIPVVLHTLANLTDLNPSCTDPTCSEKPTCLTICKPCPTSLVCPAVCEPITVCDPDPNTPSPPTPDPNTPSTPTPDPNTPSPSIEIIPGCPTCVKTVINWVITCPSATTITISTCPQVNVCSPTVLLLPPGTHSFTGRAVVPATSGSITVTKSPTGTAKVSGTAKTSGTSRAAGSSGASGTGSLTAFNGAVEKRSFIGSVFGLLIFLFMLI